MSGIRLMALLMYRRDQQKSPPLSFQDRLCAEAARRRDRRITRHCLRSPAMSPFTSLLYSTCDQSLITMTGLDRSTFRRLLVPFTTLYSRYTPYSKNGMIRLLTFREKRRGTPRAMNAAQCLGLTLAWYRTRGGYWSLCMLFGITSSVCSLFLRFGRRILLRVMSLDEGSLVKMPNKDKMKEYQAAISAKHPLLTDVYGVSDGVKLHLEQSGDCVIQNMFYNGWKCDHFVSNVFVFSPSGHIIACAINAPGNMHDSAIAEWGGVYEKLQKCFNENGGKIVVDSAFSKVSYPFLIKSAQDQTHAEGAEEFMLLLQATAARQASEWGMRAFQSSFPRMKDRFVYEAHGERKICYSVPCSYSIQGRLMWELTRFSACICRD